MPIPQAEQIFKLAKDEALEWFDKEIAGLRSGRVKPGLVDSIQVELYGSRSPLKGLASVSNMDARTILVSPWDKNAIAAIQKAITEANIGVMPTVDGSNIRLAFPSLTEEVRNQTIKTLHAKAEEARIRMRQGRDEALRLLKQEKEKGTLSEDDFYGGKKHLDELIAKVQVDIEGRIKAKEQDIKTI
ncbi:MAG TPA: ribosome-recycling factor [Candidatus Andersenbacteria bacterium]|nr:ribosome-recycling factor [Candidatus Andersenbacteria bacterium]